MTTFSETSDSHTKLRVEETDVAVRTAQIHLETVIAL